MNLAIDICVCVYHFVNSIYKAYDLSSLKKKNPNKINIFENWQQTMEKKRKKKFVKNIRIVVT